MEKFKKEIKNKNLIAFLAVLDFFESLLFGHICFKIGKWYVLNIEGKEIPSTDDINNIFCFSLLISIVLAAYTLYFLYFIFVEPKSNTVIIEIDDKNKINDNYDEDEIDDDEYIDEDDDIEDVDEDAKKY